MVNIFTDILLENILIIEKRKALLERLIPKGFSFLIRYY